MFMASTKVTEIVIKKGSWRYEYKLYSIFSVYLSNETVLVA